MEDFKHKVKAEVEGRKRAAAVASDQIESTCITVEEKGKMRIDHDKLREILLKPEIGDKPIAIISICGAVRTGKSFMMNYFAKYLNDVADTNWMNTDTNANWRGKCFKWKFGGKRETSGIRIANKIFKSKTKDGEEIVVLLMDTQGLFDKKTPADVNVTLMTLTTLMSSVQIFNTSGQINTQHLDYLKTCVDFAMGTAQTNEPYFKLQDLIFLVRDSPEASEEDSSAGASSGESFGFDCGKKYLNDVMESLEGGAEQIATRERIKKSFNKVRCFTMSHPGMAVLEKNFSGKPADLRQNFQECVKKFVENIVHPDNLIPKRKGVESNGMKARELLNMIAACDSIFAEKRYAAEDMMKANVKAYYSSECEEAILDYDKKAENIFHDRMRTAEEIQTLLNELKNFALRRFRTSLNMGDGKVKAFYSDYLENKCDDHCKSAMERWEVGQREMKANRAAKTAKVLSEYEIAIAQRRPNEPSVDEEVLVKLHESCLDELTKKNAKNIDIEDLRKRAKTHLESLLSVNRERQGLEKKRRQGTRICKSWLLLNRLQEESSKFWKEKLMKCLTDKEITDYGQDIKKKLIAKYIDEALTADEKKGLKALDEKIKGEYKKALHASQNGGSYKAPDVQTDPVDEIFSFFVKNLEDCKSIDASEGKMELAREKFYDKCSVHIRSYLVELEYLLDKKLKEAKTRNEEHLIKEKEKVPANVENLVMTEERHLEEREIKANRPRETERVFTEYENTMAQRRPKEPFVDEAVIVKMHESCLGEMIIKNGEKIDIEELRKRAKTHLENLLRVNRERQELETKLREETRKWKLLDLHYTLQEESSKFWTEKLMKCFTDKEITDRGQEIKKKLIAKYIDEALTEDEKIDLKTFDEKMKGEHGKSYVATEGKQEMLREQFYDKCSVHIRSYLAKLRDMLDKKLKEAKARNEENLMKEKEMMTAIINDFVLTEELHLEQILSDRFIPEDKLQERYEILTKEFTNHALVQAWKIHSPDTVNSYIHIAQEKLKESLEKMVKQAEKYKSGAFKKTGNIPPNDNRWKKLKRRLKKRFFSD